MRIAKIVTYHLRARLKATFGFSQYYKDQRENLLVEVIAEDGTSGWGECCGPARPIREAVHSNLEDFFIGQDVFDTERLWHAVWQRYMDHARHGAIMSALSGIDMALWDLKGKFTELPLYRLLGGTAHEQIPCYAILHYFPRKTEELMIQILEEEAARQIRQGFHGLKIEIGKNLRFDRRLIETMRRAFPDTMLMADAGHAYSFNEALRIGRVLEDNGFSFFEEPVAPHASEDFTALRLKLDMAIAAGGTEQTRFGFRRLVDHGGVDLILPNLCLCGGISEGLKIRAIANAFGVDVTPRAWGTWIGFAAALHFHATNPPNPGRYEQPLMPLGGDLSEHPVKDDAFTRMIEIKDGWALIPQQAGLGVVVDKKALAKYMVG